ncbi:MAG TPA: hypothetical protein VHS53_16835 [Mucilaginibacter sp.]|jgi:hypothetical protein|nr:hypothetical protein [Mucilaginibacter sp.]
MSKSTATRESLDNDPQFIRHSDEMQDIISAVPARFIRWGLVSFFFVFVMIVTLATFIRFPTLVHTTLIIHDHSFAALTVPQSAITSVHTGQEVLIQFKAGPSNLPGLVKGKITRITVSNGSYIADVSIQTNDRGSNEPLYLKPGMQADAAIKTENLSILTRIFHSVYR